MLRRIANLFAPRPGCDCQGPDQRVDKVTGLPNAHGLAEDLDELIARADEGDPVSLTLFDLEGFKKYNDSYGYASGDALLSWLAGKLVAAVPAEARVYRLRGDEFCVVVEHAGDDVADVQERAADALFEMGEGFMVRCSHGSVILPNEADGMSQALTLADQRLHMHRTDPRRMTLSEAAGRRSDLRGDGPRLAPAPFDAAALAVAVGRQLGLGPEALDDVECAAELRDVGNMAIPDPILHRAGALGDDEWRFVRLHTLVGERVLHSSMMEGVAKLVRSSHERWDGGGYPDGLAGQDIPLESRIVFTASAFQDMTSERSHRAALSPAQALGELRTGAGSQFDPYVVEAFEAAFAALSEESPAAADAASIPAAHDLTLA